MGWDLITRTVCDEYSASFRAILKERDTNLLLPIFVVELKYRDKTLAEIPIAFSADGDKVFQEAITSISEYINNLIQELKDLKKQAGKPAIWCWGDVEECHYTNTGDITLRVKRTENKNVVSTQIGEKLLYELVYSRRNSLDTLKSEAIIQFQAYLRRRILALQELIEDLKGEIQ